MARERLKLSQPALAAKLEKDPDTIKKIERGVRVTQWVWLASVCEALAVSPNEILGFPV